MKNTIYSAIFMFGVMSSFAVITWCQMCGTKAYGGSPSVLFYATTPEQPSDPQNMKRFFDAVAARSGSTVTLTCIAREPQRLPFSYESNLQPYMINWFVNYSKLIQVSDCDNKPHKMKECSLSLVNIKPRDSGKYFCQAVNGLGCTYKQLRLTVTNGEHKRPKERSSVVSSRREKNLKKVNSKED